MVIIISPNIVGDSNDENNFPHKLLLTNKFRSFVKLLEMVHRPI